LTDQSIGPRIQAECPDGTRVVGGGVSSASGEVLIRGSHPSDLPDDADTIPDDAWDGRFTNPGASSGVIVHAACRAGGQLEHTEREGEGVPIGGSDRIKARCPAQTAAIGGGATASGIGAYVQTARPLDGRDPGKTPEDGWLAKLRNDNQVSVQTLMTHAICKG
jgi:hypothetical protein